MQLGARAAFTVASFLFCLGSSRLSAMEQTVLKPLDRPDPASITVPKLATTSKDEYFFFYKAGVSYQTAFSDLDECRMYSLQARITVLSPRFVPLGAAAMKSEGIVPSAQFLMMYGVVGLLVAEPFVESAEEDSADATDRRCMAYKGYTRYGVSRAMWKQITAGTDGEKLARLALLASGSEPQTGAIGP